MSLPFRARFGLWGLAVMACFASLFWAIELFSPDTAYVPASRGAVADISQTTSYERAIAEQLRQDPVYVDPLMDAWAEGIVDDQVRAAVVQADFPTYLVVLPDFNRTGPSGSDDVTFARIIEETGRTGLYLRLSDLGHLSHEVRDDVERRIYLHGTQDLDRAGLLRTLEQADADLAEPERPLLDRPVPLGLMAGAMLSVPLWFLLRLVRRSSRRDTSYLEGLL